MSTTTYKVYCRIHPTYNLTAGEGKAILAPAVENDYRQHWYKDHRYSEHVDLSGNSAFFLVNKATGLTLKHSNRFVPVQLATYNADVYDELFMWALAEDSDEGYSAIRSLDNTFHLEAAPLNDSSYHGAISMAGQWIDAYDQHWKIEALS